MLARSGEVLTDVLHTGNAVPTHQIEVPLIAGKLLGLDTGRLQDAVGICCTQPQVTSIPAWTADAKGLLSGWPVLTGVEAALYARAGISGRRDILESPAGYCYRVSDIASPRRLDLLIDGLGEDWRFDAEHNELFTKRYPDRRLPAHRRAGRDRIVLAGQSRRHRVRLPDGVKRLSVRMPWVMAATATMFTKDTKEIYDRIRTRPDWTYIPLLFDGKYPLAAALANRRLTWREYRPKVIFDPVVQALIDKIELVPDLRQRLANPLALAPPPPRPEPRALLLAAPPHVGVRERRWRGRGAELANEPQRRALGDRRDRQRRVDPERRWHRGAVDHVQAGMAVHLVVRVHHARGRGVAHPGGAERVRAERRLGVAGRRVQGQVEEGAAHAPHQVADDPAGVVVELACLGVDRVVDRRDAEGRRQPPARRPRPGPR